MPKPFKTVGTAVELNGLELLDVNADFAAFHGSLRFN